MAMVFARSVVLAVSAFITVAVTVTIAAAMTIAVTVTAAIARAGSPTVAVTALSAIIADAVTIFVDECALSASTYASSFFESVSRRIGVRTPASLAGGFQIAHPISIIVYEIAFLLRVRNVQAQLMKLVLNPLAIARESWRNSERKRQRGGQCRCLQQMMLLHSFHGNLLHFAPPHVIRMGRRVPCGAFDYSFKSSFALRWPIPPLHAVDPAS